MYPTFGLGIIVGLLCGIFGSACLWAILFHQVQEMRRAGAYGIDPLAGAWIAQGRQGGER